MNKINIKKETLYLVILFVLINVAVLVLSNLKIGVPLINYTVVLVGNLLLFALTFLSYIVHTKSVNDSNPYAFIRGIMLMTLIKLMVLGTSVVVYLYFFKETKNIPAILVGLLLYVIYSIFDVRAASQISKSTKSNKKIDAEN